MALGGFSAGVEQMTDKHSSGGAIELARLYSLMLGYVGILPPLFEEGTELRRVSARGTRDGGLTRRASRKEVKYFIMAERTNI